MKTLTYMLIALATPIVAPAILILKLKDKLIS
jgi:hypothetical protein